jgi:RimJ/RimL family protein N-acetyltransferase
MSWTPGAPIHITAGSFIVRSLEPADITERYAGWWADPAIIEGVVHPKTPGTVERHRQRLDQAFDNKDNFQLGIFDASRNLLVGFFTIKCTRYHRLADLSLVIGDYDYRPPPVLDDPWKATLGFIFESLRMDKVAGKPIAHNETMTGAFESRGFRLEATLRQHWLYHGGQRVDVRIYGLSRREWRAREAD